MDLQKRKSILDAEDVVKIHFTNVMAYVLVVDSLRQNEESIPGLNGIHRCKKLL